MTMKQVKKRKHQLVEDMSELLWLAEAKKRLRLVRVACAMKEAHDSLGDVLAKMKREAGR
jgi:hypothetical protein